MASVFHTLLTQIGAADLTQAQAFGFHVPVTHLAVGDGGGTSVLPTEGMTSLVNEQFRIGINSISVSPDNPNWLVMEAVIPANAGGWMIREIGLIGGLNPDDIASPVPGNKLLAVGNFPETYKPLLAEGAAKDLVIRMIIQVANASLVELKIDPAVVVATQKNLADAIAAHSADAGAHPYAPITHVDDPEAHEDIRLQITQLASSSLIVLRPGDPLPLKNVGLVWHDDYNSIMTWQAFFENGADYEGYASILIGSPLLDAQPTPRRGYIPSGFDGLDRFDYAALRNWAIHTGIMVDEGVWVAGAIMICDNADGLTFRVYDLRGEFPRFWDNGRGVDPGRGFGSAQGDAIRNITGTMSGNNRGNFKAGTGAFAVDGSNSTSAGYDSANKNYPGFTFNASRVVPTADENRVRNTALSLQVKF